MLNDFKPAYSPQQRESISSMALIRKKLFEVQKAVKTIKKNWNPFDGISKISTSAILKEIQPALVENKLVIYFFDNIINSDDEKKHIKSTIVLTDIETGESVEVFAVAKERHSKKTESDEQCTAVASAYARRCALVGLLGLDSGIDINSMVNRNK